MMKAPVFVKIERYREVEETLAQIKAKIAEARDILGKLSQIKAEEEHELQTWHDDVNQIEEKVTTIEQSMSR